MNSFWDKLQTDIQRVKYECGGPTMYSTLWANTNHDAKHFEVNAMV